MSLQERDSAVGLIKSDLTQADVSAILTLLRKKIVKDLDWPSKSPNLNVIENLWDELYRRIKRNSPVPQTLAQLREKLMHEWNNIPKQYIQMSVTSLRRRIHSVFNA